MFRTQNYKPIEKRWEAVNANGYEIINDSYNANPESMRAFIDTIFELYKNYIVILGDMGELGENEIKYHKELGDYIQTKGIRKFLQLENYQKYTSHILHFDTVEDVSEYIKNNISKDKKIF